MLISRAGLAAYRSGIPDNVRPYWIHYSMDGVVTMALPLEPPVMPPADPETPPHSSPWRRGTRCRVGRHGVPGRRGLLLNGADLMADGVPGKMPWQLFIEQSGAGLNNGVLLTAT